MNNKNTFKKIVYIFFIGIALIIVGIILSVWNNKPYKGTETINKVEDEKSIINFQKKYNDVSEKNKKYNNDKVSLDIINDISIEKNRYSFVVPNDVTLESKNLNNTLLSNDQLKILCDEIEIEDLGKRIDEIYNEYIIGGYKVTLLEGEYNSLKIFLFRLQNNSEYKEVLILYAKNAENYYNFFKYEIKDISFSNKFINYVVSNLKKEVNAALDSNCDIVEDEFLCSYDDKKISYKVDTKKYAVFMFNSRNNYISYFKKWNDPEQDEVRIMIYYDRNDIKTYMKENYMFDSKYEEKIVGGKSILEYSIGRTHNAVIYIDNNRALVYQIMSQKNGEELLNDFLNYTIQN